LCKVGFKVQGSEVQGLRFKGLGLRLSGFDPTSRVQGLGASAVAGQNNGRFDQKRNLATSNIERPILVTLRFVDLIIRKVAGNRLS
jgi:hypothetical protein